MLSRMSRAHLIDAIECALWQLRTAEDRAAVLAWANETQTVAVGAWKIDDCRCPVSAVGIDRLTEEAQDFASQFDAYFEIQPDDAEGFRVVDEEVDW